MKILIASPIDPGAIERLAEDHDVVCGFHDTEEALPVLIRDCEALVFRSGVQITAGLMESAPQLRLLIRAGSGLDNLDVDYVRERGIELVRIPEPGARAVAELTFALMLALSRHLFDADRSMREGHWKKRELGGYLIENKTLGIIGLGNIGTRVAAMGRAWGMDVVGCVEHPGPEHARRFADRGIGLLPMDRVVARADYLSIHVPLKASTRNLVGDRVLRRMKPGSYLLNLARGGVVDERALYDALCRGDRIRGAALDVHEREGEGRRSPFADLPNVILTPHIGATAVDAQREIGRRVIATVQSHAAGVTRVGPEEPVGTGLA